MISIGRLRRDRGISLARPAVLGNPFVVGHPYTRAESISRYRDWLPLELDRNPKARGQMERIIAAARVGDVTLLCWCAPAPCHDEVIREHVEARVRLFRGPEKLLPAHKIGEPPRPTRLS